MRSCPQEQEAVREDIEHVVGWFWRRLTAIEPRHRSATGNDAVSSTLGSWSTTHVLRRKRSAERRRCVLRVAQVVALSNLDAVVAQDVVGRGDVKIKIRYCMAQKELPALVAGFLVAALDHDFLVLRSVDLAWRHGLEEGHRLGDTRFEVG